MENIVHSIVLDNKSRVSISSVSEVTAFSDKEIKLKLKDNTVLLILGSALKISCFDNKNGNFSALGKIEMIRYKDAQDNLIKKVFK
ncbi:MAG: YabP/YqfC family sporulation protein [Clostridia bacterium]|nr:YabP/YqfC family sporulation protein [Clostridia bacterium]